VCTANCAISRRGGRAAHLEGLRGSNPLNLVFPSQAGTPLYPKNVRRRHFVPALRALGLAGIRPHDFRRTFIAFHVEAGTHPKLVQERVGHSSIGLTMDVYGKVAGRMMLAQEQEARFDALTVRALPAPVPLEPENSGANTATNPDSEPAKNSDPESSTWRDQDISIGPHRDQGN